MRPEPDRPGGSRPAPQRTWRRFPLVPRTKVNYGLWDLARALFVRVKGGPFVEALRGRLEKLFDRRHVLLTASGRGALYVLLKALPHPRVVLPAYTCKAVAEAATLAGKEVLHVEIEADGFNMEPEASVPLLGPDVIVVATHQFGIPCDMKRISELARAAGAYLVEDVAAALGSRIAGRLCGTFGDAAFFSFDLTKLVNVPLKGGFCVVSDPAVYERMRSVHARETRPMPWHAKYKYLAMAAALVLLENHALYRLFHNIFFRWRGRFTGDGPGFDPTLGPYYQYELAEWQAGIAVPQIDRLEALVETRRLQYSEYLRRLQVGRVISLPPEDRTREWACIRFPIRVAGNKLRIYDRAVELGTDLAFSFTYLACPPEFERAHRLADTVLDLPFYDKLTDTEMEKVVAILNQLDLEEDGA